MDTFKFKAFCQEFPFLVECFKRDDGQPRDPKDCDGITIKRITPELLTTIPKTYDWDGSMVGISEWERVDLVLSDGTIIRNAIKTAGTSGSNYAHSETREWEGESPLEAIARQGPNIAKRISYMVWLRGGYNVVEHYSQSNWSAIIYKPAKDLTLTSAITEAQISARTEVKAEANF